MASFHDIIKIKRVGVNHQYSRELYFYILKMPWSRFVFWFVLIYLLLNGLFGCLYLLDANGVSNLQPGSFFDAFAFSSQTFSTVGYGYFFPKTHFTHTVVIIENMAGILFIAIVTGLTFAKFARPTSSVVFSNKVVITVFDGVPTLMFRLGNGRETSLVDARISLTILRTQKTSEGHEMQRFLDLKLERSQSPFFIFTWTVMHKIDSSSPLFQKNQNDFLSENINFYVSLIGQDETFSETVHTGWIYSPTDVYFNKRFVDVIELNTKGVRQINFNKFHDIQ